MGSSDNIVLVGPMGVGKSTIGRLLAQVIGYEFKDTDHVIEERSGADIPWIFDIEGEAGFRERETAVLRDLIAEPGLVLATGGGIITQAENRELLEPLENVVYLTAGIDQLVKRTRRDRKRPLLQVDDPRAKIIELFNHRDPLYKQVSTFQVSTEHKSPKSVVEAIRALLERDE